MDRAGLRAPCWQSRTPSHTTSNLKDAKGKPSSPPTIKLRRQGDTLRVVAGMLDNSAYVLTLIPHCRNVQQITGSFFASSKRDSTTPDVAAADKSDASFMAPTFDCMRPGLRATRRSAPILISPTKTAGSTRRGQHCCRGLTMRRAARLPTASATGCTRRPINIRCRCIRARPR
jgi:hypothetical protein